MTSKRQTGFSLLELLIVVAVIAIVAAIATPNVMNAIAQSRLRSAVNSMSSVSQDGRIRAVRTNSFFVVRSTVEDGRFLIYVDLDNNGELDDDERQLVALLPPNMRLVTTGAPSIASMNLGMASPVARLPSFNARGLPCAPAGAVCNAIPGNGYVMYVAQARLVGRPGWGAITVSPTGRVRAWTWSGSRWN